MKFKTTIKPLGDFLLVMPQEKIEKTSGGIYIPDSAKDKAINTPQEGVIVAVGPGSHTVDGTFLPVAAWLKPGVRVIFGKDDGISVKGGYKLVREVLALAVDGPEYEVAIPDSP